MPMAVAALAAMQQRFGGGDVMRSPPRGVHWGERDRLVTAARFATTVPAATAQAPLDVTNEPMDATAGRTRAVLQHCAPRSWRQAGNRKANQSKQ